MRPHFLAVALFLAPAPLLAQVAYAPAGQSDADALAEQVRRLGSDPRNLEALLTAGELSIRLEDFSAASAFFARAERVDPASGRVKAGEGAVLVHSERPAEALRYFAQAEGAGLAPARFAAERGLAYDLLGDPGRAQRDYRAALASGQDGEARRRYALSLAIAGRQRQALDELDPLIRRNDRAAWRTRAFVLAMGGDADGALRIAETMMPPGAAAGLAQFFRDLPRLPAIDRAFAVHFGEVRATPQRLADARLAPQQAPLAVEPEAPAQVAAAAPAPADQRRSRRDRRRNQPAIAVAAAPLPPPPLPAVPSYEAPAYTAPAATTPVRDRPLTGGELAALSSAGNRPSMRRGGRTTAFAAPVVTRALTPAEEASLASAGGADAPSRRPVKLAVQTPDPAPPARPAFSAPVVTRALTPAEQASLASAGDARPRAAAPLATTSVVTTDAPASGGSAVGDAAPSLGSPGAPPAGATAPSAVTIVETTSPDTPPPTYLPPQDLAATVRTPLPAPGFSTEAAAPTPTAAPPEPAVVRTPAPAAAPLPRVAAGASRRPDRRGADSVLARIVAGLTIPASELEVAPVPSRRTTPRRSPGADADRHAHRGRAPRRRSQDRCRRPGARRPPCRRCRAGRSGASGRRGPPRGARGARAHLGAGCGRRETRRDCRSRGGRCRAARRRC